MTVAELFVNLGVKGSDKSKKEIAGVKEGLSSVAESGIAAKAAILAVVYGLERMTASAGARGMELQNFAALTGLSAQELQKWQVAAARTGTSAEEMSGSIKGVQSAMSDMLLGKGAPSGLGMLANKVGFDPARARDTFYVLDKLQQFARSVPPDVANNMMRSFGLSDNVISSMRKGAFEASKLRNIFTLSDSQIAANARVETAWVNFWNKLKNIRDTAVSEHGLEAVSTLARALDTLVSAGKNIGKLGDQFKNLETVAVASGLAIAAAWAPLTATITGLVWVLSEWNKKEKNQPSIFGEGKNEKLPGWMKSGDNLIKYIAQGGAFEDLKGMFIEKGKGRGPLAADNINFSPSNPKHTTSDKSNFPAPVTMNNVIHVHESRDAKSTAKEVQKEINRAYRQSPAQGQGS